MKKAYDVGSNQKDFDIEDEDGFENLDDLASALAKKQEGQKKVADPDYDKKTKKMSEYLLMGYTMLEECCYGTSLLLDCNLPFMRDRKGKTFCAGCDKVLKTLTEIVEQKQQKQPEKPDEKATQLANAQQELASLGQPRGMYTSPPIQNPVTQVTKAPIATQPPVPTGRAGTDYNVSPDDIEKETMKVFRSCIHRAVQEIYELNGPSYREKAAMMAQLLTSVKMI